MDIKARPAGTHDLPELVRLYRLCEAEMGGLHRMWNMADGLAEPVENSLSRALNDEDTFVFVGELDGATLGFVLAVRQPLLPQAGSGMVGSIKLIFTQEEAREVGIGEAMLHAALDEMARAGVRLYDAHVLPGHRLAKNFFESAGFSARSIVMHRGDI